MTERDGRLISRDFHSALNDIVAGLIGVDTTTLDPASRLQFDRAEAAASLLEALAPHIDSYRQPSQGATGVRPDTGAEIGQLLDRLMRRWQGHAAAQGAEFRIEAFVNQRLRLDAPAVTVERILSNLVENAVQHAPYGRVTLSVRTAAQDQVQFAVTDEGPGFSDVVLGQLFSHSSMPGAVPEAAAMPSLPTAKRLALELGGDITVHNVRGGGGELRGACATLSLRCRAQESHGQPTGERHLRGMHVLLADSDRSSRQIVADLLRDLGASCTAVGTGEDAFNALRLRRFDAAILDALLPPDSGGETIRKMRNLPGPRGRLLILVITSADLDEEGMRLFDAGADTLIPKLAGGPESLFDTMWTALHEARCRMPAARPHRPIASPAPARFTGSTCASDKPARPSWMPRQRTLLPEETAGSDVLADRLDHLVDIAGPSGKVELIERLSSDLARCRASLATAFYERDLREIRAQTHILISLTGAVGATRLHSAVHSMNLAAHENDWSSLHLTMSKVWPDLETVCEEVRATRSDLSAADQTEVRPA
ncbi:MAG: ATP-binding protein [Pseudomonadota bacterium]